MDLRFQHHNIFRDSVDEFRRYDPHLRQLAKQSIVYTSPLITDIDTSIPGVYTLTGGRQVGKSTLLKQLILSLLEKKVDARNVYFISCELVNDYHDLVRIVQDFLEKQKVPGIQFLFIDEITYVKMWDRAIKHLADTGQLEDVFVMITGSDSVVIREARMHFPGRRGKAKKVDFHYHPLSFNQFVSLRRVIAADWKAEVRSRAVESLGSVVQPDPMRLLYDEFNVYCITGGYLTAINDWTQQSRISRSTLSVYSDWIRGDLLRRGKSETYLREILSGLFTRYGSQLTWNNLSTDLSIDHPSTVAEYLHILESMNVAIILPALLEHKLVAAPKKAKKVYLADPFIFHALDAWLSDSRYPFEERISRHLSDIETVSRIVEGVAVAHYSVAYATFYIKGKGEIDIAYVEEGRIFPVEVKWRRQIRSSDLKEVRRFPRTIIASRSLAVDQIYNRLCIPLPLLLLKIGA